MSTTFDTRGASDESVRGSESSNINVNRFIHTMSPLVQAIIVTSAFITSYLAAGAWVRSEEAARDVEQVAQANKDNAAQVMREYKQIQVQLMYTNALMIREGMVKPGDMVFGPEGNLEYDGQQFIRKEESNGRDRVCNSPECRTAFSGSPDEAKGYEGVRPADSPATERDDYR